MVIIANTVGIFAGATEILESIFNIIDLDIAFDTTSAKHLTYAFGHIFANCAKYMAVIAVYEVLAEYTGHPWRSNKVMLNCLEFSNPTHINDLYTIT